MLQRADAPPRMGFPEARVLLLALLAFAFCVSVVHYADNVLAYERYPRSERLPNPSAEVILGSWFVFTAAGLLGAVLFLRRRVAPACLALAVYAGSGLVGIGHYAGGGAGTLTWWRHLHILTDIACGVDILAFALWAARRFGRVTPR